MYYSYDEFVSEMGWDEENFNKYSLQELAYSHFALYRGAPLVVCNVFDPAVHKTSVSSEAVSFDAKGAASLKHGSVSRLVLKNAESSTTYVEGTDYTLDPISGELSRIEGGSLPAEANVTAGYDYADVSLVDSTDVIGGINESTGESEGLELIDSVFPQFRARAGQHPCPALFRRPRRGRGHGGEGGRHQRAVQGRGPRGHPDRRRARGQEVHGRPRLQAEQQPFGRAADRVLAQGEARGPRVRPRHAPHRAHLADRRRPGGRPLRQPSNKRLEITSIGYPDEKEEGGWKELFLGLDKCNYLNGEGIYTAVNWDGGMKSWGGRMSAYPSNTDPKDCQDAIRRFFNWYQSTFILTYFQKVDNPLTRRQIQTILKSEQIRLDGYAAREMILGGSISFDESDNPATDLIDGIAVSTCGSPRRPPTARSTASLNSTPTT